MGRFDLAMNSYAQMLELGKQFTHNRIDGLIGMGIVNAELGKTVAANSFYKEALHLARQVNDTPRQAIALANLGQLHLDLGDRPKALEITREAYSLIASHGDPHTMGSLSISLIEMFAENNQFEEAKKWADKTVVYLSMYSFDLLQAQTFLSIGKLRLETGDAAMALASFNKALALSQQTGVIAQQLEALNLLAESNRRIGNPDSAGQYIQKSLQLCEQYPFAHLKWNTYFYLGSINRDAGDIAEAENNFNESINIVRNLAAGISDNEQRSSFSEKIQPVFEEMVLMKLAQNDSRAAFTYAELERAQVFKILLQNSLESSQPELSIKAGVSGPFQLQNTPKFSLANLQSHLTANEIVVEYEMTDSCLVAWLIGPNSKFVVEDTAISRDSIDLLIKQFRSYTDGDSMSDYGAIIRTYPMIKSLCKRFYDILISLIASDLRDSTLIYFIPDETLNYLPFAALMSPENEFLIESHPIVMQPSAEILHRQLTSKRRRTRERNRLLTVATNTDLRYSFEEARKVASLYPEVDSLIGTTVSELDVRRALLKPHDVILFSLHGNVDEKRPYLSSLLLKSDAASDAVPEEDQRLSLQEIQTFPLSEAELVYLSSCESAAGRLYRGEGIVGLQRAVMIAGARSVVANLWKIEDRRTKNQTLDFFKIWSQNGDSKAMALQSMFKKQIAELDTSKAFDGLPHPCLWAAVTLAGNAN